MPLIIDGVVALALAAGSLLAHWPLWTTMLYAWDSVLYAQALDHFDVGQHRPQPPGYLFYVLAARLVRDLTGLPPNDAYVVVSHVAAAATVGVLYLAGCDLFDRPVGLVAALLAATSVAFSIYSAVAYPYTVLALGSTLLGWLCWRVADGRAPAWLAGLTLGLLSGFRQDLLLFLGPLALVSVGVRAPRRLLAAALAGAVGVLAWFVPSSILSGGVPAYLTALTAQSQRIERDTSVTSHGLAGLIANVRSVARYSLNTLSLAALPAGLYAAVALLTPAGRRDRRAWHLALWAGPAALFYSVIHIGDIGYVFSLMPAAWLAAAAGLALAARWLATLLAGPDARRAPALALALLAALPIAVNIGWLAFSAQPLSAAWLRCRDRQWAEAVTHVRATYTPATTVLLTSGHYQQVRYELPEYPVWFQDPLKEPVMRRDVPPGTTAVVIVDWLLETAPHARRRLTALPCGHALAAFAVAPGDTIVVRPPLVELSP
ncbi:MAG: glycosyltransferase family 39 protein [Chloroflexi bacterium]|nr:glycosyltransferase family 39 protein [Chloroflexota bacterium]